MLNTSAVWYFGSRAIAAAGNLLAVAVFTRQAGPAEYGQYLLIFAWSLIVYGFSSQWMRFAYFGVYQNQRLDEYVASLVQLLAAILLILAGVFVIMALLGTLSHTFLIAIFALVCGMTIYESAFEVTRTLLDARSASISMVLRAVLIVAFGSVALWSGTGASGLAFAIATAHLVSAIPCLMTIGRIRLSQRSRAAALDILRYGWPLLLSFGVTAIGQGADRLLLAHFGGTATLGPYGVLADIHRQSFSVVGEAIILTLVTVAKKYANEGDVERSRRAMRKAFNACLTAATFGAAFFFVFGEHVVWVLLGPEFTGASQELIPIFAVAFAFITMRNFYFAQVIYFTYASHLELVISLLFVVVSAGLSVLLIPDYGALGAAIGLMSACVVSCLGYAVIGRRYYRLPIDLHGLCLIPLLAGAFLLSSGVVSGLVANVGLALFLNGLTFAGLGSLAIYRFGLLRTVSVSAGKEQVVPSAFRELGGKPAFVRSRTNANVSK
jgi:O-antigen/teichoic acid export membrane protein